MILFFVRELKKEGDSLTEFRLFRYANNDTSLDDVVDHFATDIRSLFAKTSGFDGLKSYVSYGHGDEGINSWYGANNLKALTALKESWDPRNLFRFNNPIKP